MKLTGSEKTEPEKEIYSNWICSHVMFLWESHQETRCVVFIPSPPIRIFFSFRCGRLVRLTQSLSSSSSSSLSGITVVLSGLKHFCGISTCVYHNRWWTMSLHFNTSCVDLYEECYHVKLPVVLFSHKGLDENWVMTDGVWVTSIYMYSHCTVTNLIKQLESNKVNTFISGLKSNYLANPEQCFLMWIQEQS